MEQVTSIVHLQIPAQPSPGDPAGPKGGEGGAQLGPAHPCEQPGGALEAGAGALLMAGAGALILVLLCAVLLLVRYRHRWAQSGSLQYISFHHSARYTLKDPCPSPTPPPQPAPRPPSLP
ncbi:hypothetical protein ANANG_G00265390, partial [Anguilla anguilla]